MGCFVYIFLGSCKDIPMGPTAIASLLTYQAADGVWQKAVLLSLLTGIVEIVMCILGFAFLLNFVSGPVSSGFTSAVAVIILTSQVKDLFAIKAKGSTFIEMWTSIFENIDTIRLADTIMGISCIVILLLMRLLATTKIGPEEDHLKSCCHKVFNKFIWLVGTARNAIIVIMTGLITYLLHQTARAELQIIGEIPPGMPTFQIPSFHLPEIVNKTTGEIIRKGETFTEIVSEMGSFLIVIPLIALLENISVCNLDGMKILKSILSQKQICLLQKAKDFCIFQPALNRSMRLKSCWPLELQTLQIHLCKDFRALVHYHVVL